MGVDSNSLLKSEGIAPPNHFLWSDFDEEEEKN